MGTATAADAADADAAPTTLAVANRCRRRPRPRRRRRRHHHRPCRRSRRLARAPCPVPPAPCAGVAAAAAAAAAAGDDATVAGAAEQADDAERPLPVLTLVPRRMDADAATPVPCSRERRAGPRAGCARDSLRGWARGARCVLSGPRSDLDRYRVCGRGGWHRAELPYKAFIDNHGT